MFNFSSIKNRFSGKSSSGCVGLEFNAQGIALSYRSATDQSTVQHCELILDLDDQPARSQLKQRVSELKLKGFATNVVLPVTNYNLLLVEAPKVPSEELAEAMRWKVKDLLPYPLEESLVELFHLPAGSTKGRTMVYVVAARLTDVQEVIDLIEGVDLKLNSIDIQELALRNLVESQMDTAQGVGLVHLEQNRGLLILIQAGDVYLSRKFDIAYNAGLFDELPEDQLVLELQRSLDYYERQMGQRPPKNILLCGENISNDKITKNLKGAFSAQLSVFELSEVLVANGDHEESLLQMCTSAIGGALRKSGGAV